VAVPDRDEFVLRFEVREVNLLAGRLLLLAGAMGLLLPVGLAAWPF
jgi:hypothetical protein